MILPQADNAIHKAWLYRLLTAITDDDLLGEVLAFKGGTCAAMLDWLDRFSVDLDFDLRLGDDPADLTAVRTGLEKIFSDLGLEIKDNSTQVPQYFLRYPVKDKRQRSTIKIDITMPPPQSNRYAPLRLTEIDRIVICQTRETMFANKLVVLIERFEKNGTIAARDLYDIHYFFLHGYRYEASVIRERRNLPDPAGIKDFFQDLHDFISKHINQRIIDQDLNPLLPYDKFRAIRKNLKPETLLFLTDEKNRL